METIQSIWSPSPPPKFKKSRQEGAGVPSLSSNKRPFSGASANPFQGPVLQRPFVLLRNKDEGKKLSSLSVFAISKQLKAVTGALPESVNKTSTGDLLLRCNQSTHINELLKLTTFAGIPCVGEPHRRLNQSKGVIRCRDLAGCPEQEIVEGIDGVVHAHRMKVRREGKVIETNTIILTFDSCRPPTTVRAGYLNLQVSPYIPNPLRCFNCQKFGHGQAKCRRAAVCARCGKGGHSDKDCSSSPCCPNCRGEHTAFSKECPTWLQEKAIQRYKAEHGVSFVEARRAVCPPPSARQPPRSYAEAARSRSEGVSSGVTSSVKPIQKGGQAKPPQKSHQTTAPVSMELTNRFSVLGEEAMGPSSQTTSSPSPTPSSQPTSSPSPSSQRTRAVSPPGLMDVEVSLPSQPPSASPPRPSSLPQDPSNTPLPEENSMEFSAPPSKPPQPSHRGRKKPSRAGSSEGGARKSRSPKGRSSSEIKKNSGAGPASSKKSQQ